MKTQLKKFAILFIALVLVSCNKDDNNTVQTPIPASDVFAFGSENASPYNEFTYKNNTKSIVSVASNENSQLEAMCVEGNDIYVTGNITVYPTTGNSFTQACYWKNNVKINLPHYIPASGGNWASGLAITIVNGDIYILGIAQDSFGVSNAISIWKNGAMSYYASVAAGSSIHGRSICVYNNDIYVAGSINDGTTTRATYWKNGVATTISSTLSSCSDIKVDQTGIHIVYAEYSGGGVASEIKYWKDGVKTTISTQRPEVGKMLVKGSDVYITGAEREAGSTIFKACYWKNGAKTELASGNTLIASDIKLGANGDVFVFSRHGSGAASSNYWQNNVIKTLGNNGDTFRGFDINNK